MGGYAILTCNLLHQLPDLIAQQGTMQTMMMTMGGFILSGLEYYYCVPENMQVDHLGHFWGVICGCLASATTTTKYK